MPKQHPVSRKEVSVGCRRTILVVVLYTVHRKKLSAVYAVDDSMQDAKLSHYSRAGSK